MSTNAPPRLLCVDDDASILASLRRQLRGRYDVVLAHGARAGLASVRDAGPFAVVLSDLHMPGMDGLAFLAEARALAPHMVAVLLTGSAECEGADMTDTTGLFFCQLPKPCLPDLLWATLDAAVAQHVLRAARTASPDDPCATPTAEARA